VGAGFVAHRRIVPRGTIVIADIGVEGNLRRITRRWVILVGRGVAVALREVDRNFLQIFCGLSQI
jgi:hypothetical protein